MTLLKRTDSRMTVNQERPCQARTVGGYEFEFVTAPSVENSSALKKGQLRPLAIPEQEWLLLGRTVSQVVIDQNRKPARIVAPDPRLFALHKYFMSESNARDPKKKPKDRRQAEAVLKLVAEHMPHYPLGEAFLDEMPPEIRKLMQSAEKNLSYRGSGLTE